MLNVMEIERFAIHDGDGIRTAVFLKGCPLHCPWCANPESQDVKTQLMYSENKCCGCSACARVCPAGAAAFAHGRPVFDRSRCTGCGRCVANCPTYALKLSGRQMGTEEILTEVNRDRTYYEVSGGGLTLSGGEPFVQYEGFLALLADAKKEGLHTAVETAADVPKERFAQVWPYIDQLLLDIKHWDGEKLHAVTGASLERIQENLRFACRNGRERVTVRVPVIPGFNSTEKDMEGIFRLAAGCGAYKVHLLPYHTMGKDKYRQLGRRYPWPEEKVLAKDSLFPYRELGVGMGLQVRIGG